MAKTNDQVKHLFAHKESGSSNNLHSDGLTLRSYATMIAFWDCDKHGTDVMFISSNGMTPTTASNHLSGLGRAASDCETFYSPAFGIGYRPDARDCIQERADELLELFKSLPRKRANLEWAIGNYEEGRAQVIDFAARFGVDICELPEASGDLKEKAAIIQEQEKERARIKAEQDAEQRRQLAIQQKADFDAWLKGENVRFPSAYKRMYYGGYNTDSTDYLTIHGDVVVTSQGAEAPLDHVKKAIRFYLLRIIGTRAQDQANRFTPYQTNGHKIPLGHFVLDSIDEDGNVKAGCHRFSAAEVSRFIAAWPEVF